MLLSINKQFYQTFARQFSLTRQRLQPGVQHILDSIPMHGGVLDLGCGNGEFARQLAAQGFHGFYVGLDASTGLLAQARQGCHGVGFPFYFLLADLSADDWDQRVCDLIAPAPQPPFACVVAFAVLHHLPGETLRARLLAKIRSLLDPAQGCFIHSEWQFLNSARLRSRIQDWRQVGLSEDQVDPGDYLLDWRLGGTGLRYVHHFTQDELANLAEGAGFTVADTFFSDGEAGKLGIYQIWTCRT